MKLTGPMFSLDARGTIGSAITFSFWKGINYARARVIPNNPKSAEQMAVRDIVSDASIAWKTEATVGAVEIDTAYKTAYNLAAAGMAMSGFNLFIKEVVAGNLVDTLGVKSYDGTLAIASAPGATIA